MFPIRLAQKWSALALPFLLLSTACEERSGEASVVPDGEPELSADTLPRTPLDSAGSEVEEPQLAPTAASFSDDGPRPDLPPNELGDVLVLEYHRLGENEGEFVRSAANFRKDLQSLYEKGYRPITVQQLVEGDIDVPAGTTPVVFTIDDSSLGQFYFNGDGSIDPSTMMGMWAEFRDDHPGWKNGATWCILPGADYPSNFFGHKPSKEVARVEREAAIRRKMEYLVEHGHEICNHTMWHARLDKYDDAFVQDQIGSGEDSIRAYLPEDYDVVTFALPLGRWPKNRSLAWRGSYRDGRVYEYKAILEVAGGPNPSPFAAEFDQRSINRFIVAPGHLERQLEAYERAPARRFVSDGDPMVVSVPAAEQDRLNRDRLAGRAPRVVPAIVDNQT